ncbi:MAG: hypothetical protein V1867_02790 [Candidatus Falkowbacteria bacterium]
MEQAKAPATGEVKKEEEKESAPAAKIKKCRCGVLVPWFGFVFFALAYYVFFKSSLPSLLSEAGDIANPKILSAFTRFGAYAGFIMAFLSALIYSVLALVRRFAGGRNIRLLDPVFFAAAVLPWYFFARELVYNEPRYTDIGRAIITFVGGPALITAGTILVFSALWFVISLIIKFRRGFGKKAAGLSLLIVLPFVLGGCVGELLGVVCDFIPDADHCWQGAAVQEGDPYGCEKIEGKGFSGSNPPKDKCYLQVAENTGDLSACDRIEGGPMSYTREECILGAAVKFADPAGCAKLTGADKNECVSRVGPKMSPGSVIEIDDQIALVKAELEKGADPELSKQLKGLEEKRGNILGIMSDANKKNYESMSDPLNREASLDYHLGKIDETTRDTLITLNDRLRERGESMEAKDYQALRDVLAHKNDPKNNIENMDEREMLQLRWNEKVGNAVDYLKFWNSNPTAAEQKYDEQLFIYERMLERQAAIDKGLSERQQDIDRNLEMVKEALKDKAWEMATDEAKKAAFGELMDLVESDAAGPVTAILGEAIDTVKKEAKSAEFRGLVRAYNLGMEEELAKAGGNIERAHAAVTANLQKDPYMYEDKNTFAKYGNILENKDCDGSNPHCVSRDIFWKAMKKSYKYQNQTN